MWPPDASSARNAVDDFVVVAEWLISEGLAAPDRLVAETNNAGGPVVGAAVIQRPDLFGAALFGFPLLDLIRYDEFTGGARWVDQIGSVSDSAIAPSLVRLSPVHRAEEGVSTGLTIGEYVRRRRLLETARELRARPANLATLAASAGYSDQSHLTREFRRLLSTTPHVYRERHRGRGSP